MAAKATPEHPVTPRRYRRLAAAVVGLAVVAAACGSDVPGMTADPVADAQARVADAQSGLDNAKRELTSAGQAFCGEAKTYVSALDRYGKLFTDATVTVGDVKTAGADLTAPRESVVAAGTAVTKAQDDVAAATKELTDAQAELARAQAEASGGTTSSTAAPTTTTSSTLVPPATLDRVKQAEADLNATAQGITDQTPLVRATVEYHSAAFALQVAWLQLLADSGCLTDQQVAQANEKVVQYTLALQTQLQMAGYYKGELDGVYGPQTVDAVQQLQTEAGLPPTGLVDRATALALDKKLAALGRSTTQSSPVDSQTAALQTVLSLAGYWSGPVDGIWSDQLTVALMRFQTALGIPATGAVDAATLAAFEEALASARSTASSTTSTTAAPPAPSATGTTVGTTSTTSATTSTAAPTTTTTSIPVPTTAKR